MNTAQVSPAEVHVRKAVIGLGLEDRTRSPRSIPGLSARGRQDRASERQSLPHIRSAGQDSESPRATAFPHRFLAGILLVSMLWAVAPAVLGQGLPPAVVLGFVRVFRSAEHVRVLGTCDLDGDGHLDIIWGDRQYLGVLWGQEGGMFREGMPSPYSFLLGPRKDGFREIQPVGDFFPLLGTVGDLDSDDDLDVVAAVINTETGFHELIVFENKGDRLLRRAQTLELPLPGRDESGLHIRIWALSTINPRDSQLDLVLGVRTPQAWEVWQLRGTGPFQWAPPELVQVLPAGARADLLDEVNRDAIPDIVVVRDPDEVGVMIGQYRGFKLTLSEPVWLRSVLGKVLQVKLVDVDNDGLVDLVVLTSKGIEVWFQRDSLFVLGPVIEREPWGTEVHLGDFNGDGMVDILFPVGPFRWAVLCGASPTGFHYHGSEYRIDEIGLITVDLDGDGRTDLLTASGTTLRAYFTHPGGESLVPMDAVSLVAVGDLSEDGAPDILVWDREGFKVLWNDGQGGLIREEFHRAQYSPVAVKIYDGRVYVLNQLTQFDWMTRTVTTTGELVVLDRTGRIVLRLEMLNDPRGALCVCDFNGDGEPDVLALGPNEVVIAWSGQEAKRYPWTAGELSLAWCGPANPEGGCDVFVVSTAEFAEIYALSLDPQGITVRGDPFQLQGIPVALGAADFDGDGQLDPVALCWMPVIEGKTLKSAVVMAVGFSSQGLREWEVLRGDVPHPFTGLAVADFDGNGAPDLAFSLVSGTWLHILWNNGAGQFSPPVPLGVGVGPLAAVDLDGNGMSELIGSTTGLAPHLWILWNGGAR